MSKPQRIVLSVYFLSLAYCFVWVPWRVTNNGRYGADHRRLGYGWLWAGPKYPEPGPNVPTASQIPFSDIDQFVKEQPLHHEWDLASLYASPDMTLIALRVIALGLPFTGIFVLINPPTQKPSPGP